MFKDNVGEEDSANSWMPRCSITTLLYRIAFTVLHATFFLERQSVVTMDFMFALEFIFYPSNYFVLVLFIVGNFIHLSDFFLLFYDEKYRNICYFI